MSAGVLLAGPTRLGSATGTGNVAVNGGTLGGGGIIAEPVTVGAGSNSGAILPPSFAAKIRNDAHYSGSADLYADATYSFTLKNKKAEIAAKELP